MTQHTKSVIFFEHKLTSWITTNKIAETIMNYYEIYSNDTGELVAKGTARECRKMLGCASLDSFYTLASRAKRGINKSYTVTIKKGGETDYPVIGNASH